MEFSYLMPHSWACQTLSVVRAVLPGGQKQKLCAAAATVTTLLNALLFLTNIHQRITARQQQDSSCPGRVVSLENPTVVTGNRPLQPLVNLLNNCTVILIEQQQNTWSRPDHWDRGL